MLRIEKNVALTKKKQSIKFFLNFVVMVHSLLNYYFSGVKTFSRMYINKKCAAEAAHEKCRASIAATQVPNRLQGMRNKGCIFTDGKTQPYNRYLYKLVSQIQYNIRGFFLQ